MLIVWLSVFATGFVVSFPYQNHGMRRGPKKQRVAELDVCEACPDEHIDCVVEEVHWRALPVVLVHSREITRRHGIRRLYRDKWISFQDAMLMRTVSVYHAADLQYMLAVSVQLVKRLGALSRTSEGRAAYGGNTGRQPSSGDSMKHL